MSTNSGKYLRPGMTAPKGAQLVGKKGDHAEENIMNHAELHKQIVEDIGATRPICVNRCQPRVIPNVEHYSTPLKIASKRAN